jgi:cellulose synthase/poly-beta-1,6-N-acetylglucosamine synthase-like glycosyltransferase
MDDVDYPPVAVLMPVRNEEPYLADAVRHVLSQDYPGPIQLVVAVAPSKDRTAQIAAELAWAEPRLTVIANPTGKIPAGLNLALRAARYDIVARMDGHAMMRPGYLRTGIAELIRTGAADVGGVMAAEGVSPFQRAVAWAMTSRIGVGSATWHTGGEPAPADSAYLGIYHRSAIQNAGGWDETMLRAEDWELNYRIRAQHGLVWCTPALQVTYRPRATIKALASQYWHYGRWRRVVMREHPETASFRYLAPPVVTALVALSLVSIVLRSTVIQPAGFLGIWSLIVQFGVLFGYLAGVTLLGAVLSRGEPAAVRVRIPVVLATMHMSWGAGFLTSPRGLHRVVSRETPVRSEMMGLWVSIFRLCWPSAAARGTSFTAST